ncbi:MULTISPECIES: GOLPH3/VPS74 family protein [unclassified Streptomyces]|uniref:GOLPH3/VPS74 family protein n=1 Tax=unclassified Streptomyces TaxID=2593676 RepID=UPI000B1FB75D|nr:MULTISPECIES: GPP34 family phosphoprotein [unclassified Streptomyces]MCX5152244.1 GPP34 family phosphoprotein [Streptomyces sp. NBC_00320]WSN46796.1 GPP34 family phosphoprotein [Streptomyces sp. NBC_01296]
MTTAKDLFIIAMDPQPDRSVGQGDLSLALAGAELIDLIGAQAVALDGDSIVPGQQPALDDRQLGEASAALVRQVPYEQVEDWLWRRGRDLAAAYQAALEADGQLARGRSGRSLFGAERLEVVDSPARREAVGRWEADEPVLAALAAVVGIASGPTEEQPGLDDEAVTTVLAVVNDAVMELEAVRQRRSIEKAAFSNVWRGP